MIREQNIEIGKEPEGRLTLLYVTAGFLPVTSIVLHCLRIIPLQICLLTLILPLLSYLIVQGFRFPETGKVAAYGWLAGIAAVFLYDLSRIPFMMLGWGDFIPKIGAWLHNTPDPDAVTGYFWRYAGNGGGMGMAYFLVLRFFRINKNFIRNGILYGLFIFSCLMIILVSFEEAQKMMFKITPLTFTGSLTGHIIYGYVLGVLSVRFNRRER